MYVQYPVEEIAGKMIYRPREIQMIDAQYGIVKTDDKAYREYEQQTGYKPFAQLTRLVDGREETLYDFIDTETGYVLVRVFKGQAREFMKMFLSGGYYWKGEHTEQIEALTPVGGLKLFRPATKVVGIYEGDNGTMRSYRKLEVCKEENQ